MKDKKLTINNKKKIITIITKNHNDSHSVNKKNNKIIITIMSSNFQVLLPKHFLLVWNNSSEILSRIIKYKILFDKI